MPKKTFYNLDEDKQNRIIDVAINEFINYSYHKGSITRIVEEAGIAKGSFYQYFQGKKDIFKYIIDMAEELEEKHIEKLLNPMDDIDIFKDIKIIFKGQINFAKDKPKLAAIRNSFIKTGDDKIIEDILGDKVHNKKSKFKNLLNKGINNGDIKPSVDVEGASYILNSMSLTIVEYFDKSKYYNIDFKLDEILNLLYNGIKEKRGLRLSNSIEDRFY